MTLGKQRQEGQQGQQRQKIVVAGLQTVPQPMTSNCRAGAAQRNPPVISRRNSMLFRLVTLFLRCNEYATFLVTPAKAGVQQYAGIVIYSFWIPSCAGMTLKKRSGAEPTIARKHSNQFPQELGALADVVVRAVAFE